MLFTPCRTRWRSAGLFAAVLVLPTLLLQAASELIPIRNAGFEDGLDGWIASKEDAGGGLSQVSPEAAHTGKSGLRVKQAEGGPGSWLQSSKTPLESGRNYRLSFWARCVEESGIGVWAQFYGEDGKNIPTNPAVAMQVLRTAAEWAEYHLDLVPPTGTASMTLAVHSYSKAPCLADLDDFTLAPAERISAAPAPVSASPASGKPPLPQPDPARVQEIASYLDAAPHGVGPTINDRKTWDALAGNGDFDEKVLARAANFLAQPIPEVNSLYEKSIVTGDRKADEPVTRRRFRLATFVLAEGMENKGRFLPAIESEIQAICAETSWILSGHVKFIKWNDLGTAMTAWNLSTAVTMLGDRLSDATRKTVHDEVMRRVIGPFLDQVHGKTSPPEFWRDNPNNWNAVVHGGIVGSALSLDESVQERAEIVAAAEKYTLFYIQGFPADGYSAEGMGYWKYGFGHYVMLSEAVLAATHGKVNLYDKDAIRLVAQFPRRFEMVPGIYPAYSDALFTEEPSAWLFHIIDKRYGLGDQAARSLMLDGMFSSFLYAYGINLAFDSSAAPLVTKGAAVVAGHRIRDWFEQSEVLVDRPPAGVDGISFSIKGGNNGTSHGHNDLGSFVVAMGRQALLVDPGSTVYGGNTFGPHRYENQVINSYGHSVPKVAGQLQMTGPEHSATVTAKSFSDGKDSVTLDLKKGYDVPALLSLARRYEYTRADRGSVTVSDQVSFSSPQTFGVALMTFGEAKEEKPGVWTVSQGGRTIRVEIDASGLPFVVKDEVLKDETRAGKVHRLGIDLTSPITKTSVTVKITPVM